MTVQSRNTPKTRSTRWDSGRTGYMRPAGCDRDAVVAN
jgi:hypothetical protein